MHRSAILLALLFVGTSALPAVEPPPIIVDVEGQPLAANAERLAKALDFLGMPLPEATAKELATAIDAKDAKGVQKVLDARVLFVVNINPESRVKAVRGPAEANLQQSGYVPVLVKVTNESTVKKPLRISSPQSGPVYSGAGALIRNSRLST